MKADVDVSSAVEKGFDTRDVIWRHGDDGAEKRRCQTMLVEGVGIGTVT